MIVVKFDGELEEKLRIIVLLRGVSREELINELKEKAINVIKSEIEREYNKLRMEA